ncbi:Phage integrase family protein [Bacillus paranthracis]|uniref:tyrosine-type recombinase/integrase n=1 Tax=Bacillus cereus group TaxID=86661 RepID=UPI000A302F26|nr:tyrosine-type recombinase/integrase [Bacillus paranthracis]MCR6791548.1 tyrosine-type recombinase/integrase [Bacillus paranthracis]MED1169545.1 tyrosine-type recombinase/integrase [Bacillus paranthracis]SME26465.1 Phage integrase family protein [Bacillus paranthracis]
MKQKSITASNFIKFDPIYSKELKSQLRKKIIQYGYFEFDDDIWYCEKMHKGVGYPSEFTINFIEIVEENKEILKYFSLVSPNSIRVINNKVQSVNYFLQYLKGNFPAIPLSKVNRKIMSRFELYLRYDTKKSMDVKRFLYDGLIEFFEIMNEFPELPHRIPTKRRNPFHPKNEKNPENYIPLSIVRQFDKVMKDENNGIPLILRILYWLQRSFPNRIKEVCSIKINPIKSLYSYYTLTIPTWKQNGGYLIEEIKTIPILNSGHGKYIVDLIKRWEKERGDLLQRFPIKKGCEDILLLHPPFSIYFEDGKVTTKSIAENYWRTLQIHQQYPNKNINELTNILIKEGFDIHPFTVKRHLERRLKSKTIDMTPFSSQKFNKYFKSIAEFFNITDSKGNIYNITSHQFRHNAITDRLYIGGYTVDQVKTMTKHKGNKMPLQYAHQQKVFHKEMWLKSTGLKSPSESPVEFKGIIFNLSDKRITDRLSRTPGAYLTWETNGKKGVGLCSNINSCNPKGTDIHFECYECDWFIPKAKYYEDYKKELEYWKNIMESTAGNTKRAAIFENAIRNVNCLERIISICENGIEKYKKQLEKKVNEGE